MNRKNKPNDQTKPENLQRGRETGLQNHSIIIVKHPVVNNLPMYTERQGNMTHSKEQNKLTETVHQEPQKSDLFDKDFKTIVLNMLKEKKKTKGNLKNNI
jgi:hypothetical protein